MNKYLRKLNTNGDTIVEVLIVLGVLSLAFALASATATKSLTQSRNAQEHSQALGILGGQVELLRAAIAKQLPVAQQAGVFCITPDTRLVKFSNYADFASSAVDSSSNYAAYPAECTQGNYRVGVDYTADSKGGYYDLRVRWDGVNGLGLQQENFVYRIHEVTANESSNIGLVASAADTRINVSVKKVRPNPDNTSTQALCNNPVNGLEDKAGSTVTLTQLGVGAPTFAAKTTNGSSVATFTGELTDGNVKDSGRYRVTVTLPPPPTTGGSYEVCPPGTATVGPIVSGTTTEVNTIRIWPKCSTVPKPNPALFYGDTVTITGSYGWYGVDVHDGWTSPVYYHGPVYYSYTVTGPPYWHPGPPLWVNSCPN